MHAVRAVREGVQVVNSVVRIVERAERSPSLSKNRSNAAGLIANRNTEIPSIIHLVFRLESEFYFLNTFYQWPTNSF